MLTPAQGLPGQTRRDRHGGEGRWDAMSSHDSRCGHRGNGHMAALLAKRALLVPLDKRNEDPLLDELEEELKSALNSTGIGPWGLAEGPRSSE